MIVYDIELCPSAWLVMFKNTATGDYTWVWSYDKDLSMLRKIIYCGDTFVGFNNQGFDDMVLSAIMDGRSPAEIKKIGDAIIRERLFPWKAFKRFGLKALDMDTVDLMGASPSFVGLKAYGARMGMKAVQDTPFDHTVNWTEDMLPSVLEYCRNDLDTTEQLLKELEGPLALRAAMGREYRVDMRSLTDTQMAEQGFIKRLGLRYGGNRVPSTVFYVPPDYLSECEHPELVGLVEQMGSHTYALNRLSGHVILPPTMDKVREWFGGKYRTGIGGLHSQHDRKVAYVADEETEIFEIDAASFYPSIIINSNSGDPSFIKEYRSMYHRRLAAKAEGRRDENETLKISLNGTFGKTAAMHSPLYDPEIMLHVTLTGQLTLLALIEQVTGAGAEVVSANTDGIVVLARPKVRGAVEAAVRAFEELTSFVFEWTGYRCIAFKDVNNYFAVDLDRKVKRKGLYAPTSLKKNPSMQVCSDAVAAWLAEGVSFEETLRGARFEDFLAARNVTGGAAQGGEFLGRVVRWYQCAGKVEPIRYITNGNLVPKTSGAKGCMILPDERPDDLDIEWYLRESRRIAEDVGCSRFLGASK